MFQRIIEQGCGSRGSRASMGGGVSGEVGSREVISQVSRYSLVDCK